MSKPITKIELKLCTAQTLGAGTDGRVYLGLAGREYAVKSSGNGHDFQPGRERRVGRAQQPGRAVADGFRRGRAMPKVSPARAEG